MSGRNSIDSLQQLAPVSDADAAAVFGLTGREELLDGVTQERLGRSRAWRTTRRRRPVVLALAVVVAAATAAGAWAVLHGSAAQETTSVECVIAGVDTVIPSSSGDPAHDCAVEWQRELKTAAPRLVAYDNGHGGITVLPRHQTVPGGYKRLVGPQDVDLIQLQTSLDDYVNGLNSSCLDGAAAASFAQSKLAQFGFTGWTVAVKGGRPSPPTTLPAPKAIPGTKTAPTVSTIGTRTCVAADIVDPTTQTVTLSPTDAATGRKTVFEKLAGKLRPVTQTCESLPAAIASVRAAASGLGLSENTRGYDLNTAADNSMRCATIYETVGGTIFLDVRGPSH
jgi:hypothetical protein